MAGWPPLFWIAISAGVVLLVVVFLAFTKPFRPVDCRLWLVRKWRLVAQNPSPVQEATTVSHIYTGIAPEAGVPLTARLVDPSPIGPRVPMTSDSGVDEDAEYLDWTNGSRSIAS